MPEETTQQPTSIEALEPKMNLEGTITRTELYGAFVDVGVERDGLIHISRLSNSRVRKVTDVVNVGDKVNVWVQSVDPDQGRIALTMVEPPEVEWHELEIGKVYEGRVVRMERYGAFVDIGAERPGLLHVREMGAYVRNPEEVTRMGETIQVEVRGVDRRKRQIDFTLHTEATNYDALDEDEEPGLSPMEIAFLQAQAQAEEEGRRFRGRNNRKKRRNNQFDDDMEDIYRRTLNDR
jgi:transcriptional accessory protein Tex/SPT6